MNKWTLTFILSFMTLSTLASWSDFTFLGTLNNVVFSYRVYSPSEVAKGSSIEFKALNLNTMKARVLISDIVYTCYDGSQENGNLLTHRLGGGQDFLFKAQENICQERGGFESLSVSLDARVRR